MEERMQVDDSMQIGRPIPTQLHQQLIDVTCAPDSLNDVKMFGTKCLVYCVIININELANT
jgi:hypothetical protein